MAGQAHPTSYPHPASQSVPPPYWAWSPPPPHQPSSEAAFYLARIDARLEEMDRRVQGAISSVIRLEERDQTAAVVRLTAEVHDLAVKVQAMDHARQEDRETLRGLSESVHTLAEDRIKTTAKAQGRKELVGEVGRNAGFLLEHGRTVLWIVGALWMGAVSGALVFDRPSAAPAQPTAYHQQRPAPDQPGYEAYRPGELRDTQ